MEDLSLYCVAASYTIREVLGQIEENRNRAVLVLDESRRVCGLLCQGDIIRALASGADLYATVGQFASPSFVYLKTRDMEKAYQLARTRGMTVFPILDNEFRLIGVVTIYDIFDYIESRINIE